MQGLSQYYLQLVTRMLSTARIRSTQWIHKRPQGGGARAMPFSPLATSPASVLTRTHVHSIQITGRPTPPPFPLTKPCRLASALSVSALFAAPFIINKHKWSFLLLHCHTHSLHLTMSPTPPEKTLRLSSRFCSSQLTKSICKSILTNDTFTIITIIPYSVFGLTVVSSTYNLLQCIFLISFPSTASCGSFMLTET